MTAIIVPIDCSQAAEIQKFSMMSQNVLSKRDVQDQHHLTKTGSWFLEVVHSITDLSVVGLKKKSRTQS